jgi:hypothetical protein
MLDEIFLCWSMNSGDSQRLSGETRRASSRKRKGRKETTENSIVAHYRSLTSKGSPISLSLLFTELR